MCTRGDSRVKYLLFAIFVLRLTGVAFSPAGDRLYFSSQRAHGLKGEVYEVRGPVMGSFKCRGAKR